MAVFVPTDLPEPRDREYLAAMESLLEQVHSAMGGSVLTLFTNRRDMERLHAVLEPRLRTRGLDLIMQRRGTSAKRLRDEFVADERLSLFALKSFWEGFDAKGDTLRCVVVPRLPFGRPTDPLSRERECREGRAAWRLYVLPEAVIELKQAAGRLIRSSQDVGCLVVADGRVVTRQYGRTFLGALPVADVERMPSAEIAESIAKRFGR
jgi:ATP-dependent DNA helicase DinG